MIFLVYYNVTNLKIKKDLQGIRQYIIQFLICVQNFTKKLQKGRDVYSIATTHIHSYYNGTAFYPFEKEVHTLQLK